MLEAKQSEGHRAPYIADSLHDICTLRIRSALGITTSCMVERAHSIGTPNDRHTPDPVIVRNLNYTNRVNILRSFRNSKSFQLDSHKLLFADYSQEVSRRRKAFHPIFKALFQKGVKFTLAYQLPCILQTPQEIQYHSLIQKRRLTT